MFLPLHLGSLIIKSTHTHCDKKLPIASEVGFAASVHRQKSLQSREPTENHLVAGTHTNISPLWDIEVLWVEIGTALSEMIIEEISFQTSSFDFAVVEISSYQMEFPFGFAPKVGVILNLTPDHLARHKTMDVYAQMKKRIFSAQSKDDFCLFPLKNTMLHPNNPKSKSLLLCANEPTENLNGGYIYIDTLSERKHRLSVSMKISQRLYILFLPTIVGTS